jgi:cytochrome P450
LPKRRDRQLLRLFVAYQTIWDYLDTISEQQTDYADGCQLHRALTDALDPEAPLSYYYTHHSQKDDGDYLLALVEACRTSCAALPSYSSVRPHVIAGAARCGIVQSINHDRDLERREEALKRWAKRQAAVEPALSWFELAAAACGFAPYPLLALAAEPVCKESDITETLQTYFPFVSLVLLMLDSYADQGEDAASGNHNYISHYADIDAAIRRTCAIIEQMTRKARGLRNGHRHVTILACMVAMHLSTDSIRSPDLRASTRELTNAGGPLTRLLLPVIRAWRTGYLKRRSPSLQLQTKRETRAVLPPGSRLPAPVQTWMIWKSPLNHLARSRHRYGECFTVNITSRSPLVFICDPEEIRTVLTAPPEVLHPGEGAITVEPLVGKRSFMLLDEAAHLDGRRTILPPLRANAMPRNVQTVREVAQREIASWPQDAPFALHPRLRALTLQTALRTVLCASGSTNDQRLTELHQKLLSMLSVTGSAVFSEPLLRHGPGRRIWRRFLHERAEVDELLYDIIRQRDRSGDANSVLDDLLNARNADGSAMSPTQVRDNFMSIVLAGHETTAAQLAWAFQLLAHHPTALDKLIKEIDTNAGEEYLIATIREVLRHRPVFLFAIPRVVKQPIEIGGWTYGPPAHLLACTYLLHHDPKLYPEPHRFRPERFLEAPPVTEAWRPWGGGRKRCPGLHLATLEMKTVLRTVLATMTVRPAAKSIENPRWRSVIVTPASGSRVVFRSRSRGSGELC